MRTTKFLFRLISGHRIGIGPGILFLVRELFWPYAADANKAVLLGAYMLIAIASAAIVYPYFQVKL